jgi:predicted negative regulator of RcsB-dependent stress response
MTEEYLTDDEQLERAKQLVSEYGPWMVGAVVVGLALAFGWRYYQSQQNERALKAASQFAAVTSAMQANDGARARKAATDLIQSDPSSPYADQAQLALAKISIDEGQDAAAVGPLNEVIEHSKDLELRHVARLRLARVQIDQGKPDDALKTLADPPGGFSGAYHEVRGDAYYAKNDLAKASEEYRAALGEEGASGGMGAAMLALKIADLGLPAAAAPPPAAASAPSIAPATSPPPSTVPNKAKP